jgi:hypothetical protein
LHNQGIIQEPVMLLLLQHSLQASLLTALLHM